MAFSPATVQQALARARSICECRRPDHWHSPGVCQAFLWVSPYHAVHRTPPEQGGDESVDNCEIVCEACFRRIRGEA
jgi:hypothetical protein